MHISGNNDYNQILDNNSNSNVINSENNKNSNTIKNGKGKEKEKEKGKGKGNGNNDNKNNSKNNHLNPFYEISKMTASDIRNYRYNNGFEETEKW